MPNSGSRRPRRASASRLAFAPIPRQAGCPMGTTDERRQDDGRQDATDTDRSAARETADTHDQTDRPIAGRARMSLQTSPHSPIGRAGPESLSTIPISLHEDSLPRITVVTPSLNQGRYLEHALRSVLTQGYPNLEYIVRDGGSTDGSIDILRRYEDRLGRLIIEPDDGPADAINRAYEGRRCRRRSAREARPGGARRRERGSRTARRGSCSRRG